MKYKEGMVSCILPTHNRAKTFLQRALDSIVDQSYMNWELIIVNDGSTDNTSFLCKAYEHMYKGKIKVIDLNKNSGSVTIPRNIGITHAQGEYIAHIDDDVISSKHKLKALVSALDTDKQAKLAYGARVNITALGHEHVSQIDWNPSLPNGWGVDGGQYIYRRDVYEDIPLVFSKRGCDWEVGKAIWNKFPNSFVRIDAVVCDYHWHDTNRSLDDTTKSKTIYPNSFKKYFQKEGYMMNLKEL